MGTHSKRLEIPQHVLAAFQLEGTGVAVGAPWDYGLQFRRVVVSPAAETAAWSGKVREKIAGQSANLRISRPVRATDGRLVVGGFAANEFGDGAPAARVDEAVAAALVLDELLYGIEVPSSPSRPNPWTKADRTVWAGERIAGERVVAHLDFLSCCLFDGTNPPMLSTLVPSVDLRPKGFTAALVIVDGLLADAVDAKVLQRWDSVPNLRALARKALDYREASQLLDDSNVRSHFARVVQLLSD